MEQVKNLALVMFMLGALAGAALTIVLRAIFEERKP